MTQAMQSPDIWQPGHCASSSESIALLQKDMSNQVINYVFSGHTIVEALLDWIEI